MNKVKEALNKGEVTIGSWIQTGSPVAAEILANAGFDWIGIDCEHSDIAINEFTAIARAINTKGALAFARVRENDTLAIRQVLDMGAQGIIVPLVNNAEEAKKAVMSAKYPPMGIRGFGYARANNWGTDFDSYAKSANDDIAVIVMIESKEGVEKIEEILQVEGVDGVFIGPYDLSGSYGIVGDTSNPIIVSACEKVAKACTKYNKAAGQHIVHPTKDNVKNAINSGFTFIALGADILFLSDGAKETFDLIK